MKIRDLLDHHGIIENPFSDEDAQTDLVFKGHCIATTYHPAWDKIYGSPNVPATAVVFGEKGSGKTALRMQMVKRLAEYNADHPDERVFVIRYDDFNPFLDQFRNRFSRRRKPQRILGQWRIWDHMDAVLSLGVTQLVDRILRNERATHPAACDTKPLPIAKLTPGEQRDLLLLLTCYDQSTADSPIARFDMLRSTMKFPTWKRWWDVGLGALVTLIVFSVFLYFGGWTQLFSFWPYLISLAGWAPRLWRLAKWQWRSVRIMWATRSLQHATSRLRKLFMRMHEPTLTDQPLPVGKSTDPRYALLGKFQRVLETLGFKGVIVVVDRADEPYVINGTPELMRLLVWPMLDNKLLKHPDVGFKMLLPSELGDFVEKEGREFHEHARLDKQNLVRSLDWTGQSLMDLANARLAACANEGRNPTLRDLFDDTISDQRLLDALAQLKVPRDLFKFMYRVLVTHVNAYPDDSPVWRIPNTTFESALALYQRDREAFERGQGVL